MIDVRQYDSLLRELARSHGVDPAQIEIVDDLLQWCQERGFPETTNPFRIAKTIWRQVPRDRGEIALLAMISSDEADSVRMCLSLTGFSNEVERIASEEEFVKHVLLHEIAWLKGAKDQHDADEWAFENLPGPQS